jgi:NAD(P)-dependent dehydrogenase (short-subunit alcohol dehydrogenase family)
MRKVALITGSAKRIGRAVALHLAQSGWDLALHFHHSETDVAELKKELKHINRHGTYRLFQADLNHVPDVESLISNVISVFARLDLLVNNASVFQTGPIKDTSSMLLQRNLQVNFVAPFILTREFAIHADNGVIVNLVDTRMKKNSFSHAAYSLSKKVLWELTRMSALELAPAFRVNAIAPGAVLPPEGKDETYLETLAGSTPMKKAAGLKPVLQSLSYILENENLTGQVLFCDSGGQLL